MMTQRLRISGRVQGVGFRHYMTQQARLLGISGWVRNRTDGSVEAVVQGTSEAVLAIITWSQHGPPRARVSDVVTSEDASGNRFENFVTLPTE